MIETEHSSNSCRTPHFAAFQSDSYAHYIDIILITQRPNITRAFNLYSICLVHSVRAHSTQTTIELWLETHRTISLLNHYIEFSHISLFVCYAGIRVHSTVPSHSAEAHNIRTYYAAFIHSASLIISSFHQEHIRRSYVLQSVLSSFVCAMCVCIARILPSAII